MWRLSSEHLGRIPIKKSKSVVFTLTPTKSDKERDSFE